MNTTIHREPGPLLWALTIGMTLLILLVLRGALWLVLPALLALLLYYAMYPLMRALTHRGLVRSKAAVLVTLGFVAFAAVLIALLAPHVVSQVADGQVSVERYVQGGIRFLRSSLRALEARFTLLGQAHVSETVMHRIDQSSSFVDYVEPLGMAVSTYLPPLMLVPFLAYFFLRDGRRFKDVMSGVVPNAYFETSLRLLHQVDRIASAYFIGLLKLTLLDTVTLAAGLWLLGFPYAFALGLMCAVLAWIPFMGSVLGGALVVLVAATDFPDAPSMAYSVLGLFVVVRLLDDFVYMPMTVGRELHMHPLMTVVMILAGGEAAGIPGMMLVLPVLGVVRVVCETISVVATDERLLARHRHAHGLRRYAAARDLVCARVGGQ